MKRLVEQIRRRNVSAMVPRFNEVAEMKEARIRGDAASLMKTKDKSSIMLFNEANCSVEERSRLYVRRLGYYDSKLFPRLMNDKDLGDLPKLIPLNEDNPVNDAAKFKKKTHSRVPTAISMGDRVGFERTLMDMAAVNVCNTLVKIRKWGYPR
jgi:hypothetical protein